jgi:hypothetical protein
VLLTPQKNGLQKSVRSPDEKLTTQNNGLQVVPSRIYAAYTPDGTTLKIRIGYDSEWYELEGVRIILSYQLSIYVIPEEGEKTLLEWVILTGGHRLELSRLISLFTHDLKDAGVAIDNGVTCFLLAHYSLVDLTALRDSKTLLAQTDTVRRSQTTAVFPIAVTLHDKHYNGSLNWNVMLRDTMHLAPAGTSLAKLASAMGAHKLDLPEDFSKSGMNEFLAQNPDEFLLYAANDATLALDYAAVMYPNEADDIPITLGSEGSKIFRDGICSLNNWNLKEFDYHFRGLDTLKKDKKTYKVPRGEAVIPLDVATHSYYGGRNECFLHGIHSADTGWYDYDLSGAYPTAMALLANPDFTKVSTITGDIFAIDPLSYTFGLVDFEFPENTPYPCLPIKDKEGRGLIFVLKGRTHACAPEIYLALQMGAKLRWVQGGVTIGGSGKFDIQTTLIDLLQQRAAARKIYGKGSVQETKLKEQINSIYGKTAQGLERKRSYSTRGDSVRDLPPSSITQPMIAAMTTSLVRATVSAAMHQLHERGEAIASVTTDGFLTTAPFDTLDTLDLYGFKPAYAQARQILVGDDVVWETKHAAKTLVMITTRGGFGVGKLDAYKTPVARAGYRPEIGFYETYSDTTEELSKRFLGRTGRLNMSYNKLPSPKNYVREDADAIAEVQNKAISWEYDLKRKPSHITTKTLTIGDQSMSHVTYETMPWRDMHDFEDARAVKKGHDELYPMVTKEAVYALEGMIIDRQAARHVGMLIQSAEKGGIYRTATISYLRELAAGTEITPSWMINLTYAQKVEEFNRRLAKISVVVTRDDFKKAAARKGVSMSDSMAVELVKSLLA